MTQPLEHACDSQRIDDYLNEHLYASEQAEFEAHLSQCTWCQQQIQSRAAEPELWDNAVALLAQSVSLAPSWAHAADASNPQQDDEADSEFPSHQVRSVLESLSPTDDPEMLGRIDDYEIIGVVGVGGMGAVLKGFDKSLRRVVAIKIMAPHLAGSGSARTRFQREARAAAAITHNNVIDIYSVSEAGGLPYLVMPYARGPSLQKRIDDGGPLSVAEVLRIGRQIAAGLTAAHEQGLVHRDIKPANILLNDGIERLLITDFGVARAMDDASMTRTGVIAGTPQYMSPEQARGEAVDYRSDLFSLGSVLYTASTGRPPFRSEAAYGILRRITDDDPRPIREINPDIPDWLCRIIDRLMAKHPADRFQNAAELSELLEGCLEHLQRPTHVALPQSVVSSSSTETTALPASRRVHGGGRSRSDFFSRTGIWLMVSAFLITAFGLVAMQVTAPADIAGSWQGDTWTSVSLSSVEEAADWYTGSFTAADGRQGALQLEWSRLQRRYNGRWKVGDGQSGSITLRAGEAGSVRGAVSVDPDAMIPAETPRLWEFSWMRAATDTGANQKRVAETVAASNATRATARPQIIDSPIKGVIVHWGEGVFENACVKKGDLIVEIHDPEFMSRIENQQEAAKQHATASEALLETKQRTAESTRQIVEAHEARVHSYKTAEQQIAAAANAAVASAQSKLAAAEQEVVVQQAAFTQLKAEYERVKANFEQATTSELKFQQAERSFKEAEAKVMQAESKIEAIMSELEEKHNEGKAKESQAQADIEYAKTLLLKAETEVAQADSEVVKAEAELTKAKKAVVESETKAARQQSQQIVAPFDGYITGLTERRFVKEGDQICRMIPEGATRVVPKEEPKSSAPARQQSTSSHRTTPTPDAPPQQVVTNESLTDMFGPASDLTRRLREGRDRIESLENDLKLHQASLAQEKSELEAKILAALEQTKSDDPEEAQKAKDRLNELEQQLIPLTHQGGARRASVSAMRQDLDLANKQLADAEAERDTIIRLLQSQLDAARKQLELQENVAEMARRRFELAESDLNDVLKAEHPLAETEAKVQQLEILLNMYESLGTD